MTKIKALILTALCLSGLLGACSPTLKAADTQAVFTLAGEQLVLTAEAPVSYAYGAVLGKVSSRYCAGEVTEKPRACPQLASGWTKLDIPPGEYPQRLVVGTVQGAPADGFFDVALFGARVTYRAELQR